MNQTKIGTVTDTTETESETVKPKKVYRSLCKHCAAPESSHTPELVNHAFEPRLRGFAALPKDRLKEIASKGGKSCQATGDGHRFTSEEAKIAGTKGGNATHKSRGAPRGTRKNIQRPDAPDGERMNVPKEDIP